MSPEQITNWLREQTRTGQSLDSTTPGALGRHFGQLALKYMAAADLIEKLTTELAELRKENEVYGACHDEYMAKLRAALGRRDIHSPHEGIERLTTERDALAEQVRGMREALDVYAEESNWFYNTEGALCWYCQPKQPFGPEIAQTALALTPTAALAEYRERLLEEVAQYFQDGAAGYGYLSHTEIVAEIRAMKEGGK